LEIGGLAHQAPYQAPPMSEAAFYGNNQISNRLKAKISFALGPNIETRPGKQWG